MKLNYIKYACAALPLLGLTACLDFDTPADEFVKGSDVIVDPTPLFGDADNLEITDVTEDEVDEALAALNNNFGAFLTAQYYLMGGKDGAMPGEHQWQYIYNLTIDNYCGYMCADNGFNGQLTYTNSYYLSFCEGPYGRFTSMKNNLGNFLNNDYANKVVELKAMALLIFDHAAQEVTDIYGSVPYLDHKNNKQNNPFEFNKGYDIYSAIVDNIDDIVKVFENYDNRPDWYKKKLQPILDMFDGLTASHSMDTWKRYANSLKLRMAMHIVKYQPTVAKQWAEEAVASGVIENKDQQVGLNGTTQFFSKHPLSMIQNTWNDSRVNASFISMLTSLQHPYMNYLIGDNEYDLINSQTGAVTPAYSMKVGIRAGLPMENGQSYDANPRVGYSKFTSDDFDYMPVYAMKWAEVDFLRAEGALRGWSMGGTAEMFYERGIRNADCGDVFVYPTGNYESYLDDYLEVEEAVPFTYVDPMDDRNNIESMTKIGVKWNDSDDNETKLEKIITQKYIAIFPYSYEAWTDIRRTGYPKIFPVLNANIANRGLGEGEMVRRALLPTNEIQAGIEDVQNSGLDAIGGEDLFSTRVFWDTQSPNF